MRKTTNASLYSGSIVREGEATAVVVATGVKTYFGRTTQLVESARPKLHVEEVITRVVKWLFLIVGVQVSLTLLFFALFSIVSIRERSRTVPKERRSNEREDGSHSRRGGRENAAQIAYS